MSTTTRDIRRQAIREMLMQRIGTAPNTRTVAEVTFNACRQMAERLAPVIGARGVEALFSRSLHLTGKAIPWLALAGDHGDATAAREDFRTRIQASNITAAIEASYTLLATFTELLATLIGEPLTNRLLGPVWAPPTTAPEQETAP
ncbi:MAG TPA: hypothetical protein VM532_04615 [Burkholderiales bacterium]|jgi:hypothetical protein|nr:hypothetical protein [Burkholderiales bacterium]